MTRVSIIASCLGLLALVATGCYDTPMPACAFQCGTAGECPSGYACSAVDNICKRNNVAADHTCEGLDLADAADPNDAAVAIDAAAPDAAVTDAAVTDASTIDAFVPDASAIDAFVPDAFVPDAALPVCGDGTQEAPEACDDRNDDNCGTCSAGCSAAQPAAAATGSITVVQADDIIDTETVTIGDGFGTTVIFEFDSGGGATNTPVVISAGQTPEEVETALADAITVSALLINPTDGGTGIVTLTHQRLSSLGNVTITHTVTNGGFAVTGLMNGVAGNCGDSVGCNSPDDCESGVCTANACVGP